MKDRLCIDGKMLREIEVGSGLCKVTLWHMWLKRVCKAKVYGRAYFISMISYSFEGIPEIQVKVWYKSVSLLMM